MYCYAIYYVIVRLEWFIGIVPEKRAFKPRGVAEWFKYAPRGYYSNKPQQGHSLSGLYYG